MSDALWEDAGRAGIVPTSAGWALLWGVTEEEIEERPRVSFPIVGGMEDIPPHWKARGRIRFIWARNALGLDPLRNDKDWPAVLAWLEERSKARGGEEKR